MDTTWLIARIVYAIATLYMILVILRWFGPRLEFDLSGPRWRFVRPVVDVPLARLRTVVPSLGPWDPAPIALLLLVWVIRSIVVQTLLTRMSAG